MIDVDHGTYTPICDICGDMLASEDTYNDAKTAKKDAGWKVDIYQGERQDVCLVCQGKKG